ncbi:MAG TPA: flagellin, partial [Spirochaetota bacterium]|nr:flagellin [Spirochaetota bacterium]
IINHNISSINANRILKYKSQDVRSNMSKLSSGMRINKAGDDASGLAVSEKMRAQIRGLRRAEQNAGDAIAFIQTAEGYLGETTSVLQRVRELSIQAANGIYSSEDRMQIQVEVSQLVDEVDRIASHAQFNGMNILTGRFANPQAGNAPQASMWFHVGANMDQRIRSYIGTMSAAGLGVKGAEKKISISTPGQANRTIGMIDEALKKVNKQRADLGAYQNRLGHVESGVAVGAQNLQDAESRIRDTNMAQEMSKLVKNQVLSQATVAMLAQANAKNQQVLTLLR